jgi:hypothetical protein
VSGQVSDGIPHSFEIVAKLRQPDVALVAGESANRSGGVAVIDAVARLASAHLALPLVLGLQSLELC